MVLGILSVFGIKLNEVNMKTIMGTNGVNLGGNYNNDVTFNQIVNTGIKLIFNAGKIASDAAFFIPIFGFIGRATDLVFSGIDTSVLGSNLIKTCNKLPKNQQFFKTELEKFNYVLSKMDEIRSRFTNNHHNNKD